jgi:Domain of unknown function (DUF4190)
VSAQPPPASQISPDGQLYWDGKRWAVRTDGLATGALVLAIFSLVFCFFEVGVVLGPIAVIMAFISRRRIASSGGVRTGETRATVGIVLGILAFLVNGTWIAVLTPGMPWSDNQP